MNRIAVCALAAGLAFAAVPAVAAEDLPMEVVVALRDVIPNVGAAAGVVILAENPGTRCANNATLAADNLMPRADALETCNDAITGGVLPAVDRPGVFVNRGVLLVSMNRKADAMNDFNHALSINPDVAEALVNRGMLLIEQGKPAEGVADIDRAIALRTQRPERAYLNRGRGREDLNDVKGAYADYKMADTLKPDWEPVKAELARFTVRSR